jgi:RNA polymerase sigma-70 factor (ECF subfamily)
MAAGGSPPERERLWREYLERISSGDAQALAALYDESSAQLFGLTLRFLNNPSDAEEVLMDVYQQVWRQASGFDPGRGTVWGWLTMLTRSRALDLLRSSASRRLREQPTQWEIWEPAAQDPPLDEAASLRQQRHLIWQALAELPLDQKHAIELAYFSGMTHHEIADRLEVPLGTIKTRIRAAKDKLRQSLSPLARGAAESIQ